MDGQEYLNQISGAARAIKNKGGPGWLSSPIAKVLMIGGGLLVVLMILGAILGSGGGGIKEKCYALKLRLDNTLEVISTYQTDVKSSELRSSSASLSGILSNTSRELENYLVEKYNFKDKSIPDKLVEEAELEMEGLSNELFEAKINGNLDRIYAHKMSYTISLLVSEESSIYNASENADLKKLLQTSHDSLNNLYEKFNSFSETK